MKKIRSPNKFAMIAVWLGIIAASAGWNIYQVNQYNRLTNLETARSFFGLVVTMRSWVSLVGGVYVPVSANIQPNPYLLDPNRDIYLPNGITLTKLNPAYMTRLVAELADVKNDTHFHITSLKPIRPANAASPWETVALTLFENGSQQEYTRWDQQNQTFYYMAPLITQQSCLACHAQQGYKEGDIRGGISITMRTQESNVLPLVGSHLLLALMGSLLIFITSTRLENAVQLLEIQSNRDGLTQIYNRSYFDGVFRHEYLRSRRHKTPLSILMGDVDNFKAFNDVYGHPAGDFALKQIATIFAEMMRRPGDLAARYGGEEFVVILPDTDREGAHTLAELLRVRVEQLQIIHKENTASSAVTVSIGCSTYTGDDTPVEVILKQADQALYQAKRDGRNKVCSFG
jgi:diguanylate cyclase (GGDEF)-like protein